MNRNTTLALSGGWMLFLLLAMSLLYATVLRSPPPVGKLLPSVVRITTHAFVADDNSDLSGGGRPAAKVQESFGSGVIVDRDGYIVTNRHVVKGAYEIIVHLDDGTPLRARLVGHGGAVDLALIKIDTDRNPEPAKFGDSDRLSIGDSVYVVGNPFGLGTAVSSGIVSALNRDLGFSIFDAFIQTDASINHGNSGGPMFDAQGRVVGVNTAYYTGGNPKGGSIGLGFAIPSNTVREIAGLLKKYGYLRIGWIGVDGATFTPEMADALGVQTKAGAVVANVHDDGPAAGLVERGDIILDANGTAVEDMRMLRRLAAASLGRTVVLRILRNRETLTVSVTPTEWPGGRVEDRPPPRPGADMPSMSTGFGVACAPISNEIRDQFQIERGQNGVVVTDVQANSPASEAGLEIGDVVLSLQLQPVRDPSDIAAKIATTIAEGRQYVTMLVLRRGNYKYVTVPAKWQTPPA